MIFQVGKIKYFINCKNLKSGVEKLFHSYNFEEIRRIIAYNVDAYTIILNQFLKHYWKNNEIQSTCRKELMIYTLLKMLGIFGE